MYEDMNQNSYGGFDPDSTTYHYSYQPQGGATPPEPKKPKKKSGAGKVVALVLCCALVGGGAGIGGAAAWNALTDGGSSGSTTIYQANTPTTQVNVEQTDGVTEMTLQEIYNAYANSCVNINAQITVQQGWQQYQATSAGSGFIISQDGYIVTNYHVIDGASSIQVTLYNGDTYDATYIGGEELNDVAVLKIDVSGLTPVVLGDSDSLSVGDQVSTIGNALGSYSFSQTSGRVSGVGRSVTMSDGTVMNMIQTDCTINSGNSGGPLFNQYGEVIGITTAKYSGTTNSGASIEGIGFAIPIDDVMGIISDLIDYGYVTGAYMGITVKDNDKEAAAQFGLPTDGAYVVDVTPGSSADKAGIQSKDLITAVDDHKIATRTDLTRALRNYKAGDTAQITVVRSGRELTLTITFDEKPHSTTVETAPQEDSSMPSEGDYNDWYEYFRRFFGG